jgi:hypothetical protein
MSFIRFINQGIGEAVANALNSLVARIGPRHALRLFRGAVILGSLVFAGFSFAPLLRDVNQVSEKEYTALYKLADQIPEDRPRVAVQLAITPFVTVDATFDRVEQKGKVRQEIQDTFFVVEWQNFILYVGIVAIIVYMTISIERSIIIESNLQKSAIMNRDNTTSAFVAELTDVPQNVNGNNALLPAERALTADVALASARATQLFSRSTIMPFTGIIIAFVGVVIFYFYSDPLRNIATASPRFSTQLAPFNSDTEAAKVSTPADFIGTISDIMAKLRPTFILLFFETVAWFLLRQYRVLIEDYKFFYRIYLKRLNYLIALLTLKDLPAKSPQLIAITAMLQEDLSGRLSKGQKTEAAEQLEYLDQNPIFYILDTVLKHAEELSPRHSGKEAEHGKDAMEHAKQKEG